MECTEEHFDGPNTSRLVRGTVLGSTHEDSRRGKRPSFASGGPEPLERLRCPSTTLSTLPLVRREVPAEEVDYDKVGKRKKTSTTENHFFRRTVLTGDVTVLFHFCRGSLYRGARRGDHTRKPGFSHREGRRPSTAPPNPMYSYFKNSSLQKIF